VIKARVFARLAQNATMMPSFVKNRRASGGNADDGDDADSQNKTLFFSRKEIIVITAIVNKKPPSGYVGQNTRLLGGQIPRRFAA